MKHKRKTPIMNHLASFEQCFRANENCLSEKQVKKVYKYLKKIRKVLL